MYLEHGQGMSFTEQVMGGGSDRGELLEEGQIGYKIRSVGFGATNATGFSSLLTGYRSMLGDNFEHRGLFSHYFTSTISPWGQPIYRFVQSTGGISRWDYLNNTASVRCLKD
jgi:hypothetical protein